MVLKRCLSHRILQVQLPYRCLDLAEIHSMIFVLVAIAGAATTGSQVLIQAYVTSYYPAEMRSTGLGVASGIGRLGGMIGPILGGFLINA